MHLGMLSVVSPETLASGLIACNILSEEDRQLFVGWMSNFLQASSVPGTGHSRAIFLNYDPHILQTQEVREYVIKVLRKVAYTHLYSQGADDIAKRPALFSRIREETEVALYNLAREAQVPQRRILEHGPLFEDVIRFFEDVRHLDQAEIPSLNCFVSELPDYGGTTLPFLSLRQLFATRRLFPRNANDEEPIPALYPDFHPGLGKTPIPFVVWELRKRRRRAQHL